MSGSLVLPGASGQIEQAIRILDHVGDRPICVDDLRARFEISRATAYRWKAQIEAVRAARAARGDQ